VRFTPCRSRSVAADQHRAHPGQSRSPQLAGSIIVALAAASASARSVRGSARSRKCSIDEHFSSETGPINSEKRSAPMLRGFTTVNFLAEDVAAAAGWSTEVFGVEPYFQRDVDGVPAEFDRLISLGAVVHDKPTERGRVLGGRK
jgi:hypothetical protein